MLTSSVCHNTLDSVHFTVTYVVKLMGLAASDRASNNYAYVSARARARPMGTIRGEN